MSKVSRKLILGTAQFGFPYGVTNPNHSDTLKDSVEIIRTSIKEGVVSFDTASSYGISELVLGQVLSEFDRDLFELHTKLQPFPDGFEYLDKKKKKKWLDNSVKSSMQALGVEKIDVLYFHRFSDYQAEKDLALDYLGELVGRGAIGKIGCSIYDPSQLRSLVGSDDVDIIQLPFNPIDQRWLADCVKNDIAQWRNESQARSIFVRSIFLQGCLLGDLSTLGQLRCFSELRVARDKLDDVRTNSCITSKLEFIIAFVNSFEWIDKFVVGVDNVDQLKMICSSISLDSSLDNSVLDSLFAEFSGLSEEVIDPSKWVFG